ncbi:MAG: hypothetical protein AB7O26_05820 [Planctomycetaceae bacterium]
MEKSLDRKLRSIHADPSGSKEFILADAKDADMAFGIGAPGLSPERHDSELRFKTLAEYRQQIREVAKQGIVDIVLMSASTSELLTIDERLFENSAVTPAARANDATDVHIARGGRIYTEAARPFRTAGIDHMQCGHIDCKPEERRLGVDLGLYSVTFNNQLELDHRTLIEYNAFRQEAERKGFRHFLEIFDPNLPGAVPAEQQPGFINDLVARTLAGVTKSERPVFLKMVYHGPKALEELVAYDPHLVVGILGGAAGTTHDAFRLIYEARKYGARAALFGRKINQAENQLAFIEFLRHIADGLIEPEEAVRAYHAVLAKLDLKPHRPLDKDLEFQTAVMNYSGSSTTISTPAPTRTNHGAPTGRSKRTPHSVSASSAGGEASRLSGAPLANCAAVPDFAKMTSAERLAYHRDRLNRQFGG